MVAACLPIAIGAPWGKRCRCARRLEELALSSGGNVDLSDSELAERRLSMEQQGKKAWKPAEYRERKVSSALKAYAMLATSADKGGVRDLKMLE